MSRLGLIVASFIFKLVICKGTKNLVGSSELPEDC